jgi:hypothetical protein
MKPRPSSRVRGADMIRIAIIEGFFSAITRRQIRRGAFHSVDDLQNAIKRYIDAHNSDCRPFVWTSSAKAIFEKLAQVPVPSV